LDLAIIKELAKIIIAFSQTYPQFLWVKVNAWGLTPFVNFVAAVENGHNTGEPRHYLMW
jgi:hypothetical protein